MPILGLPEQCFAFRIVLNNIYYLKLIVKKRLDISIGVYC